MTATSAKHRWEILPKKLLDAQRIRRLTGMTEANETASRSQAIQEFDDDDVLWRETESTEITMTTQNRSLQGGVATLALVVIGFSIAMDTLLGGFFYYYDTFIYHTMVADSWAKSRITVFVSLAWTTKQQ